MSIRFKFRSSASFDSVDLEGRSSISVRDLRLKIIRCKNLNVCQDFDLVFSDAASGEEYNDEMFQIPSGASIIVKRVPAGTVPSANVMRALMTNDAVKQGSDHVNPASAKVENFDDFGTDLCPPLGKLSYESDPECQKLDTSDLSQSIHKVPGYNHSMDRQKIVQAARAENQKLEKVVNSNFFAVEHTGLPAELKCPLCNTFFTEAVLIPCCQHSFCKKCISFHLLEKKSCPMCSSGKCKVDNLLPNLSLRQAIEHFLGSQLLCTGAQNDLHKLVPDGESGIQQAKEVSCAVTVIQREPEIPHSPSATGHGSNQVLADSFYESLRKNTLRKTHTFGEQRAQYAHSNRQGGAHGVPITDFQGENQPLNLHQFRVPDEADSTIKRKGGPLGHTGGIVDTNWSTVRPKGPRNCYVCGSLEHLMRDCPVASNPRPMFQTGNHMLMGGMPGYPPQYWNSNLYSPMRPPYTHMYGHPGMMPFNASMVPTANFRASPYMPAMHTGMPLNGGIMRRDNMAPPAGNRIDQPTNRHEFMEPQHLLHNGRRNDSGENMGRARGNQCNDSYDAIALHEHNEKEMPEYKHRKDKEASNSFSGDSFSRKSKRKHQHSDSKRERSPHSVSAGRERAMHRHMERHENHHRDTRKHHHEKRGHCGSDSSRGHQNVSREEHRRLEDDVRRSHPKHHHHRSDSGSPRSWRAGGGRERDSGRDSRHSRHNEVRDERWDEYNHHKRQRVY